MTQATAEYLFLTVTLALPQSTPSTVTEGNTTSNLRTKWKSVCQKWGMNIVRELVYVQNSILEENDNASSARSGFCMNEESNTTHNSDRRSNANEKEPNKNQNASKHPLDTIIVDGCEAFRVKDQLVITDFIDSGAGETQHQHCKTIATSKASSVAQKAGLRPGDIIHAVYGMKNPKLGLLFGIMRDSITFQ